MRGEVWDDIYQSLFIEVTDNTYDIKWNIYDEDGSRDQNYILPLIKTVVYKYDGKDTQKAVLTGAYNMTSDDLSKPYDSILLQRNVLLPNYTLFHYPSTTDLKHAVISFQKGNTKMIELIALNSTYMKVNPSDYSFDSYLEVDIQGKNLTIQNITGDGGSYNDIQRKPYSKPLDKILKISIRR